MFLETRKIMKEREKKRELIESNLTDSMTIWMKYKLIQCIVHFSREIEWTPRRLIEHSRKSSIDCKNIHSLIILRWINHSYFIEITIHAL